METWVSRCLWCLPALLWTAAPAHAQNVLYYTGNVGTTTAVEDFKDAMLAIGAPAVTVSGVWPGDLSEFHVVLLARPTVEFSDLQKSELLDHAVSGGITVLIGDAGTTGQITLNNIATYLGIGSSFTSETLDSACTRNALVVTPTDMTDGVTEIGYAFSSSVDPGALSNTLFAGESGQALVVEELGIVLVADLNVFVDTCSLPSGNTTFWQNLWLANSCDRDLDGFLNEECDGVDCDDNNGDVFPGAKEDVCDGIDNDCDGIFEGDSDEDGLADVCDNCVDVSNPGQADTDYDTVGDLCDPCPFDNPDDSDGDGVCDTDELCEGHDDALDDDMDGVPNGCDACPTGSDELDQDSDELPDGCDNCIFTPNFDQLDTDGDGKGDVCDDCPVDATDDTDGDGVCDSEDQCPSYDDTTSTDQDGDGVLKCAGDCADLDPNRNALMEELCDGIDNDCDWEVPVDELDVDGDGVLACDADCDDSNANMSPFIEERCGDSLDNNCDGRVDEGCKDDESGSCSSAGHPLGWAWTLLAGALLARRRRA